MIGKMVHRRIRRKENGLGNGLNAGLRKRNTKGKKMILKRDRSVASKMAIGELVSTASYQSDKYIEENKSEVTIGIWNEGILSEERGVVE